MPVIQASTGQAPTQDPAITIKNFLSDNWVVSDPPVAQVKFDTKYRNIGTLNAVFVKQRDAPTEYPIFGPARQSYEELFDIVIYAKGDAVDEQAWKMKSRIKSLINANPTIHVDRGIEWAWVESWTVLPASQQLTQILS